MPIRSQRTEHTRACLLSLLGAGVVLINPDGLIFAGQRIDNPGPAWQMPQGGIDKGETPREEWVRFRTVGDATCTGCTRSRAQTLEEIIAEVAAARQTERGTRADDRRSETAMEDRKRQGYF